MMGMFAKSRRKNRHRDRSSKLFCESLEDRRVLATFIVTDGGDSGAGTLRQAILDANAAVGADDIEFTGVTTVTLTSAQLDVTDSVVIDGTSALPGKVTVERDLAAPQFRIFSVNDGTSGFIDVAFDNLQIQNGDARAEAHTNTLASRRGGGIDSTENTTVRNSVLTGNIARRGGALSQRAPDYVANNTIRGGTLTVDNTIIDGNHADDDAEGSGRGGALSSITTGQITITNSEIINNTGDTTGVAIETSVSVPLNISDTMFSGNNGGARFTCDYLQFAVWWYGDAGDLRCAGTCHHRKQHDAPGRWRLRRRARQPGWANDGPRQHHSQQCRQHGRVVLCYVREHQPDHREFHDLGE